MTLTEPCSLTLPLEQTDPLTVDVPALVANYGSLLFRVAHSILRDPAEAEDAVQDAFVRVLEHRARLSQIADMRVWLVRIVWNLSLDRRRTRRPDQMDDVFAANLIARTLPADEGLAGAREMQLILRAIERLPRSEREALLLSAIEELSTAAVAHVLGRSESATRALLFRARNHLKQRLQKGARA